MKLRRPGAAAWVFLLLFACDGKGILEVHGDVPAQTQQGLTYFHDVEPIISSRCGNCHVQGGIAPFALQSYDDVVTRGSVIVSSTEKRSMPPWPPAAGHHKLKFDRSLSDDEISLLRKWVDDGMPEGDPSEHREIIKDNDPQIRVDVQMQMSEAYTPPKGQDDDYRCFVLDPANVQDEFVTGYNVLPGVKAMAHHVVMYVVPVTGSAMQKVQAADAADPAPGYRCEGGPGVTVPDNEPQIRMLGSWKPGGSAVPLPDGTGLKIAAGEKILLQMHYAMLTADAADVTTVQMQLAQTSVEEAQLITVRNTTFTVPAGAVGVVATQDQFFDKPVRVFALFPHMHFLGKSVSVSKYSGPNTDLLIDIPHWQFPWQGDYLLETPVDFAPGDKLQVRCVFDNSAANQPYVRGQQQQPKTVGWGDGALDEMCLAYVYLVPQQQ